MIVVMAQSTDSPTGWPSFDHDSRPEFDRPPVIEVVLSAQFAPLGRMGIPHLGLLWDEFRDEFSEFEDKPALPPVIEHFGRQSPVGGAFRVLTEPSPDRCWFKNSTGTEMIQVQRELVRRYPEYRLTAKLRALLELPQ